MVERDDKSGGGAAQWRQPWSSRGWAWRHCSSFTSRRSFRAGAPGSGTAGIQIAAGYALIPVVIVGLVVFVPSNPVDITPAYILAFIIFGFPLLVLLAIVLPVTAIVSLVRSYHEAGQADLLRARVPLAMILLGQIAGGALALVFAPALTVIAPNSMALSVLTVIMWVFGLLTPIAFGLAVWKYDVLSISAE